MITKGTSNLLELSSLEATKYFQAFAHGYIDKQKAVGDYRVINLAYYFKTKFSMKCSIFNLLHMVVDASNIQIDSNNKYNIITNKVMTPYINLNLEQIARVLNYGTIGVKSCPILQEAFQLALLKF